MSLYANVDPNLMKIRQIYVDFSEKFMTVMALDMQEVVDTGMGNRCLFVT